MNVNRSLAILAHDGTCSVVLVSPHPTPGMSWATFGEVTPEGFSPCYAAIEVPTADLRVSI